MSIKATCHCGSAFLAKAELAGKQVTCPSCRRPFVVPNPQPTSRPTPSARDPGKGIRVACGCGRAFLAKPALEGKRVRCPGCGVGLDVPRPSAVRQGVPNQQTVHHRTPQTNPVRQPASEERIRVSCECGRTFLAKSELSGRRIPCPACRRGLSVGPTGAAARAESSPKPRPSVPRVICQCGKSFAASAELRGQSARCPSCSYVLEIPPLHSAARNPTTAPWTPTGDSNSLATELDPLEMAGGTSGGSNSNPFCDLIDEGQPLESGYTLPASSPTASKPSRRRSGRRQLSLFGYYRLAIKRWADFEGRSRRKEYWAFQLFNFLLPFVGVPFWLLFGMFGFLLLAMLLAIPSFTVTIRRLHDTGRSGWNILLGSIPIIGPFILLLYLCEEGYCGTNEYGPDPKGGGW